MLYIFEMANNHQGSVKHAKKIIDEFSSLAKEKKITAAIKFQFRQLDTFIHKDYKESDLKFVKRFNSTKLSEEQFREIIEYGRHSGLKVIATPFDNESLDWINEFDLDMVKIASCSSDDWPLLKEVAKINKKIIISTGGVGLDHLEKIYNLFKKNKRDFAFMHCVGEYPTSHKVADLQRITRIQQRFPDVQVGFSTHESPQDKSLAPLAAAMGCTILEKHIGTETKTISLNGYSLNRDQMSEVIDDVTYFFEALSGTSANQNETLKGLKRGVYLKRDLNKGDTIGIDDVYYAMPLQKTQADASMVDDEWGWVKRKDNIIGSLLKKDIKAHSPLLLPDIKLDLFESREIKSIKQNTLSLLKRANVHVTEKDKTEISCHYGLDSFNHTGAVIIDKINRKFCKKIIVLSEKQRHPTHHHIRKEEAFELLYGDCMLVLAGKEIKLQLGEPVLIPPKTDHSFRSEEGCVIEEVSTTHYREDSVYQDPRISKLETKDRKIKINILQKEQK